MKYKVDYEQVIELNGDQQNIRIVTNDEDNPVMLFVHGGPCGPDRYDTLKYNAPFFIDNGYTVVVWDQRAAGKSYHGKQKSLRAATYVEDGRQLCQYLCKKLHQKNIIVVGYSWGTYIGMHLAILYPELLKCYIGVGQMVNLKESEQVSYDWVMEMATKENNVKILEKLKGHGPVDGHYSSVKEIMNERDAVRYYRGSMVKGNPSILKDMLIPALTLGNYNIKETAGLLAGAMNIPQSLMDDCYELNFYTTTQLKIPFLFTSGHHDYMTPFPMVEKWYKMLNAPFKDMVYFENSAHGPQLEEPDLWNQTVLDFLKKVENLEK